MSAAPKKLEIIIVGAGVAGLTAAYALRDLADRVSIRILEKRSREQCLQAGYPIHLTLAARQALEKLLSPEDWAKLSCARKSLPTRHDGVAVMNSKERMMWHTVRFAGEGCMIERGDLLEILREGAGEIEYERRVVSAMNTVGGLEVGLDNGEVVKADLLIGADGMFSPVRQSLHPGGIEDMGWTTINFRASTSTTAFVKDQYAPNVIYGKGWSAAMLVLPAGLYIALTVPSPVNNPEEALRKLPSCAFLSALLADPGLEEARCFPLHCAKRTLKGKGRIVLIGDAAHGMTPFAAAGASCSVVDAYELVQVIREASGRSQLAFAERDLDKGVRTFNKELVKRNDQVITLSRIVLSLAQGDTVLTRLVRRAGFCLLELVEGALPFRARREAELRRFLAEETGEKLSARSAP